MVTLEHLEQKLETAVKSVAWSVGWALSIAGLKAQWPLVRVK